MKMVDGFPRRARIEFLEPAEAAIYDAMGAVEAAGAHPLLTDAITLLREAKEKVSDFVDMQPPNAPGKPTAANEPKEGENA